ncbi:MAG: branched-chain amino acid aminotransferase [Paludibacteraceae bacterium]|nr:branched-chain amino acid aminotransferase [Paludibacteraceae bacterium]
MKDIDWAKLTFSYTETDYMVRCTYSHGMWGPLSVCKDKTVTIPAAAAGLQYAQQCFEGIKAYRRADGSIGIFRPDMNAKRMQDSAKAMYMAPVPTELFLKAIETAVIANIEYLPPYGTGATLYIRPILFGTTPKVGVAPAQDFEFCVIVTPIGPYYPAGFGTTPFIINRHVDRAAPFGTGQYKVGGNYASSFRATEPAHEAGVGVLFLDSAEHLYLDECGGANIFLVKNGTYCTPKSDSILPSIINRSLMELCHDMQIPVEERRIAVTELAEFQEAASCGTGAAISPISQITDPDTGIVYRYGEEAGPVCQKLYHALRDIQFGRVEDRHHWCRILQEP